MEERFEFHNEKLYELRKSKGMSQEEFAERVGVSRQSIYAWESGKSLPDIENLYKMCQVLGIKSNELTNFNQEEKKTNNCKNKKIIKMSIIILIIAIFIYIIIALRQFFIVANLNKKIHSVEEYNNYSYSHVQSEINMKTETSKVVDEQIYYKDGILKVIYNSSSTGNKEIYWIDLNNIVEYNFIENNGQKTVRKINTTEENLKMMALSYKLSTISNNGMIPEENSKNFLASILFPFSYRVSDSEKYYVLNFKIKDRDFKYEHKQFISKENGFPIEKQEYRNDGKRTIEKYNDIKINETTDEDIKMLNINEYTFIEK